MPLLGITGGIATGKTALTGALVRLLRAEVFDADATAHELLAAEPAVRAAVETTFGPGIYDSEGRPDRIRLREIVFSEDLQRRKLETILHPPILARWQALAAVAGAAGRWMLVDLPLLYETGAESKFDRVIVAACSEATQLRRLTAGRGLATEIAQKMIAAQLALPAKINRADHVVWTDSTTDTLDGQAEILAGLLRKRYG